MKLIKDKEKEKELSEAFKKEMDSRDVDWYFIGLFGLIRMTWWSLFSKYRIIYFMQRCVDGMAHQIAWRDAKKMNKKDLLNTLKLLGWAE
jgi:hypothetical protein